MFFSVFCSYFFLKTLVGFPSFIYPYKCSRTIRYTKGIFSYFLSCIKWHTIQYTDSFIWECISLEFTLRYIMSRDEDFLRVPNRVTRSIDKIFFKVPAKITPIYERSPYYIGTKLWNKLPKSIQDCDDTFSFKKEIARLYRTYVKL